MVTKRGKGKEDWWVCTKCGQKVAVASSPTPSRTRAARCYHCGKLGKYTRQTIKHL